MTLQHKNKDHKSNLHSKIFHVLFFILVKKVFLLYPLLLFFFLFPLDFFLQSLQVFLQYFLTFFVRHPCFVPFLLHFFALHLKFSHFCGFGFGFVIFLHFLQVFLQFLPTFDLQKFIFFFRFLHVFALHLSPQLFLVPPVITGCLWPVGLPGFGLGLGGCFFPQVFLQYFLLTFFVLHPFLFRLHFFAIHCFWQFSLKIGAGLIILHFPLFFCNFFGGLENVFLR